MSVHFRKRVHPEIADSAAAAAELHILADGADALRASGEKIHYLLVEVVVMNYNVIAEKVET